MEKFWEAGQKIKLVSWQRKRAGEEGEKKIRLSQLSEVLGENRIEALMPMEKEKLVLLPLDEVCQMVTYTPQGIYSCEVKVIDRYKKNNLFLLELEIISPIRKSQRRAYYRHSCSLKARTRKLTQEEIVRRIWDNDREEAEGLIADISGGGLRLMTREDYQIGDLVICRFCLPSHGSMREHSVVGKVLRLAPPEGGEDGKDVRMQFVGISNVMREEIIQFIFEDGRKQRRKRK